MQANSNGIALPSAAQVRLYELLRAVPGLREGQQLTTNSVRAGGLHRHILTAGRPTHPQSFGIDSQPWLGQALHVIAWENSPRAPPSQKDAMPDHPASPRAAEPIPRVVAPGEGIVGATDAPTLPRVEVKLAASDGLGFSVVEYRIPPGFSPPPRLHRQTRENAAVYVLEGELHYWFADGEATATAGTLVHLPRLGWNRWANQTDAPCWILAIFSPAGFEQYFLELSAAIASSVEDPATTGAAIGRRRAHYGDEEQGN
ncbi:MAG: hypothetical protein DLM64_14990 [Solirubrobacterales bacterium]|nr:MAG: hypothetical protein DLM64_14990 [Solirubrobacterales bacterium]